MADDAEAPAEQSPDGDEPTTDGKGSGDGSTKKVELVDEVDPSSAGLPGYIGVGLLGGFILGFDPLRDAAQGTGPFEDAMVRFVACLLVCVMAASILGRLLDNARPENDTDRPASDEESGRGRPPLADGAEGSPADAAPA